MQTESLPSEGWDTDLKTKGRIKEINKTAVSKVGIKWKMFGILAVFIAVVLLVIWLFQVKLLNYFYISTKFGELEDASLLIEEKVDTGEEELKKEVFDCAIENYSSICVLKIEDRYAKVLIEAEGPVSSVLQVLSDEDIVKICNLAYENGGTYIATISSSGYHRSEIFGAEDQNAMDQVIKKARKGPVSAVYAKLSTKESGEYLIIQTSDLTPVQATVKTLQWQFLWIGIILLVAALVFAFILSKVITKPIIKINEASKRLADGDYDGDFNVRGYREIGELSGTLREAADGLSKAERLQRELISNVSHDLRTPLTMIKGYGEVMRDIPEENTSENLQVIIDETSRLTELVNDMLDISKIRAGAREMKSEVFSVTETVRDTLLRYEKLVSKDNYRIEFSADGDVKVCADRSMILQVIYNLINNAVNYTGEDRYVVVAQRSLGNKVRISVSDTGDGIAPEELPYIWDRYYKVDKIHRRAAVGTGLGLSIVKGVLELHGATYGVESKQGQGSTFWFELEAYEEGSIDR